MEETLSNGVPPETAARPPVPVAPRRLGGLFAGLMLAMGLASLDQNIVNPALPTIVSELGELKLISWVVTGFMLATTSTLLLYGKLSDIYGRRIVYFVAIGLFLLGSVLCGLAQSMLQLVLFRAVQGLGAGGLINLAQIIIGDVLTPRERGRYQGLFLGVFGFCGLIGPALGGLMVQYFDWRWIFYINLPLGLAALVLIARNLDRHTALRRHAIDIPGAGLMIALTCVVLLLLSWGGSAYAWTSPVILGLAAGALVIAPMLVWREMRAREPMFAHHLLRSDILLACIGGQSAGFAAAAGVTVFLPLYFQLVLGHTAVESGLLIAPMTVVMIVSGALAGRAVAHSGRYKALPLIGLSLAFVSLLAASRAIALAAPLPVLMAALLTFGVGNGMINPSLLIATQNAVARRDLGAASSMSSYFRSLLGALSVAVAGAVVARAAERLSTRLAAAGVPVGKVDLNTIQHLVGPQRALVGQAYSGALSTICLMGAGLVLAGLATLHFGLREIPLRESLPHDLEGSTP